MDLAELWLEQGKANDAQNLIREQIHSVCEGFDTMDIKRLNILFDNENQGDLETVPNRDAAYVS
jgi:hypothetical protein